MRRMAHDKRERALCTIQHACPADEPERRNNPVTVSRETSQNREILGRME